MAHCAVGDEITYDSSFNGGASVSVRHGRRRYRRDAEQQPLDDLDLDHSFDPEVIIITLSLVYLLFRWPAIILQNGPGPSDGLEKENFWKISGANFYRLISFLLPKHTTLIIDETKTKNLKTKP